MDNRYYFQNKIDEIVLIEQQEFQHLSKVRRANISDEIVGFNGDGYDYSLKIKTINKNNAECFVMDKTQNIALKRPNITVYLASIKSEALSEALNNLTQLNIKDIVIFTSQYTNVKYDENKKQKLTSLFIQASKQCERADLPNIKFVSFNEMLSDIQTKELAILAYENATENFLTIPFNKVKDKSIALIVGGEGGFSEEEVKLLSEYTKVVSLGKTILRAPVAVTALTSAVLASLGEFER